MAGLDGLTSQHLVIDLDETSKSFEDDMNGAEKKKEKSLVVKKNVSTDDK